MKNKGFTLIELLAVIVILAIIALIAVPIVLGIINDSKKSSEKESVKLYLDTVQKAIARQNLKEKYEPEKCTIQSTGDLICQANDDDLIVEVTNKTLKIEMKGEKPTDGTIEFNNGKITSYKNLKMDGKYYHNKNGEKSETDTKQYVCTRVSDSDNSNSITKGDKYTCEVKEDTNYTFYVLTDPADGQVNLIMDRNVCNDGSITYTSQNNYCRYTWYSSADNNTYGPTTVMAELYAGTKDWDNVSDMIMNYTDENNGTATDMGYTSIITSNGVTTITGKPTTNTTTVGTSSKPLKARLPKESEVMGAGCTGSSGSCPTWLMEYMTYYYASNDKYSMNNNSEAYQNQIYGYWLLSSDSGDSSYARSVSCTGIVYHYYGTSYASGSGVRPVIIVSTSDLSS